MGQNNNEGKINLVQLVLLGLGSLIGSGWLFGAWEVLLILSYRVYSYRNDFYNYIEIGTMAAIWWYE